MSQEDNKFSLRVQRRGYGERDSGLLEEEICSRLRDVAGMYLESEDLLERAAACIERLVAFRGSVAEQRVERELVIVQQGGEIDRMRKVLDDYAVICQTYARDIRKLEQRGLK